MLIGHYKERGGVLFLQNPSLELGPSESHCALSATSNCYSVPFAWQTPERCTSFPK